MGKFGWAVVGALVGYATGVPTSPYWNQDVQLYGGIMTSTPVADVWGYVDDWRGCLTLAAGANFMNDKERSMLDDEWNKFIQDWAHKGNTSCRRR